MQILTFGELFYSYHITILLTFQKFSHQANISPRSRVIMTVFLEIENSQKQPNFAYISFFCLCNIKSCSKHVLLNRTVHLWTVESFFSCDVIIYSRHSIWINIHFKLLTVNKINTTLAISWLLTYKMTNDGWKYSEHNI